MSSALHLIVVAWHWLVAPVSDISTNLIAAAIGGIAVWSAGHVRHRRRTSHSRRFWAGIGSHDPLIVIGSQDPDTSEGWERSGLIGAGDVRALLAIQGQLRDLNLTATIFGADEIPPGKWRGNLILIGGPDANRATATVLTALEPSLTSVS